MNTILQYIGNYYAPASQNRDHLSDLPSELLAIIFNKLPFGKNHVNFSLVSRKLCQIAVENMSPIDNLIVKKNQLKPFIQENHINTFLVRDIPENKAEIVITGDLEEYRKNPVVTIWEKGKLPLTEREIQRNIFFISYFYKPIFYLEMGGGASANYVAAAQYNRDGRLQIWDIEKKIKLIQTELGKEISFFLPGK